MTRIQFNSHWNYLVEPNFPHSRTLDLIFSTIISKHSILVSLECKWNKNKQNPLKKSRDQIRTYVTPFYTTLIPIRANFNGLAIIFSWLRFCVVFCIFDTVQLNALKFNFKKSSENAYVLLVAAACCCCCWFSLFFLLNSTISLPLNQPSQKCSFFSHWKCNKKSISDGYFLLPFKIHPF